MNTITTFFGGEKRTFAFNLNEIEELQRIVQPGQSVGIGLIIGRVMDNEFYIQDIYHTIRLGLIGGGECAPTRAQELVDTYVIGKPLSPPDDPSAPLAVAKVILGNIMFGVAENDGAKKPQGDAATDTLMSPPSGPLPSDPEAAP